jgi:hypothetical protein
VECRLLTYISYYRSTGVLWLFKEFGNDISPTSETYHSFLKLMADQDFARGLAHTVGVTYAGASEVPRPE